jgi:hypothetical protein
MTQFAMLEDVPRAVLRAMEMETRRADADRG